MAWEAEVYEPFAVYGLCHLLEDFYPGAALINILEISFNIYRNFKNYVVQFGFSLNGLNQFV